MDTETRNPMTELASLLRQRLEEKSLSMRAFCKGSGMSLTTLSKILAGRQEATIPQLQKLSVHLDLPMEQLLLTAGILPKNRDQEELWYEVVQHLFTLFSIDCELVVARIEKALDVNQQYASLEAGKKTIYQQFLEKLETVSGAGIVIEQLKSMYEDFCQENIPEQKRAILGSGLLYFVQATDEIPDYMFPIGYLDDVIAMTIVERRLRQWEAALEQEP